MAEEVKQEIQEGQEPEPGTKRKLFSMPVVVVSIVVLFLVVAGAIFLTSGGSEAVKDKTSTSRQDPESWKESTNRWRLWDLGTVWVTRRTEKAIGDRKISAKFGLLLAREFVTTLEADLALILKSEVRALVQSVLDSREPDIRKDPKRARRLVADDLLRGLKMGVNPNDPHSQTYQFPFNEENLRDVFIEELQITRW